MRLYVPFGCGFAVGGAMEMSGQVLPVTVTVAALLFATGPHYPVTRTQYDVVAVGETMSEALLVPVGDDVSCGVPMYH